MNIVEHLAAKLQWVETKNRAKMRANKQLFANMFAIKTLQVAIKINKCSSDEVKGINAVATN